MRRAQAAFPAAGGPFIPRNYGGQSFGPVRIRDALASSLNIAAVDALSRIGADRLFGRLVDLNLLTREQASLDPGLGLTLGVAEVRLVDLANAYVTLARGGLHGQPSVVLGASDALGRPVITEETGAAKYLPAENGMFFIRDAAEAASAARRVLRDWTTLSRQARECAVEVFDSAKNLRKILGL